MTCFSLRLGLAMFGLTLIGCGHSAPTRYLTLTAFAPAAPLASSTATLGPISVHWPAALDRLEVMQPTNDVIVLAVEFSRWSAPPGQLAAAVLAENLQARLPGLLVVPVGGGPELLRLTIDVLALERDSLNYNLTANVDLRSDGGPPHQMRIGVSTPAGPPTAAGEAQAISRLLGLLADRVAAELPSSEARAGSALTSSAYPAP